MAELNNKPVPSPVSPDKDVELRVRSAFHPNRQSVYGKYDPTATYTRSSEHNKTNPLQTTVNNGPAQNSLGTQSKKNDLTATYAPQQSNTLSKHRGLFQSFGHALVFSLRTVTFFTLIITFCILFLLITLILAITFGTTFFQLDQQIAYEASVRTTRALYDDMNTQLQNSLTFAAWNDSVTLLQEFDTVTVQEYIETNFFKEYLNSLGLHFVLYYFLNGTLAFSRTLNPFTLKVDSLPIPTELLQLQRNHPLIVNVTQLNYRFGGYFYYEPLKQLVQLTSIPIQSSIYTGPTAGAVVYGRILIDRFVKQVAIKTQSCVSYHLLQNQSDPYYSLMQQMSASSVSITPDVTNSNNWQNVNPPPLLQMYQPVTLHSLRQCWKDTNTVRVEMGQLVRDIYGTPLFMARADIPRDVYSYALLSIFIGLGCVLFISLIAGIVICIFVERRVLHRIVTLTRSVDRVSTDFSQQVQNMGKDELGIMSHHINGLLNRLEDTHSKLKNEHAKLQLLLTRIATEEQKARSNMNAIPEVVLIVEDYSEMIVSCNEYALQVLHFKSHEIQHVLSVKDIFKKTLQELKQNTQQGQQFIEGESLVHLHTKFDELIPTLVKVGETISITEEGVKQQATLLFCRTNHHHTLQSSAKHQKDEEFEFMWHSGELKALFHEYCVKAVAEENFLFLVRVEEYRSLTKTHERVQLCEHILEDFLTVDGVYELNISKETIESDLIQIQRGIGQIDLFDHLDHKVRTLMAVDVFQRWKQDLKSSHIDLYNKYYGANKKV